MKIEQVNIFNYGKWHQVQISLRNGLNIIYGRNEAGKTTLLSFIKGVLFGYLQRQTSHKNYIPRKSKNYGGQLEVSVDDHKYIIQRMAGKNGGLLTILNGHGDQLDNSILRKIIGPFDRNTFNALYYFGTVNLKTVGKLKRRDLIYRIQRIGLAHSNDWIDYRESLEKQSKKLYSPRGYKPPLNQKLKRYGSLMDQVKQAKSGYQTYQDLLKTQCQLQQEQKRVQQQLDQQNVHLNKLNRDQNVWTRYQKLSSLRPEMKKHVAPGYTNDDAKILRHLNERSSDLKNRIKLIRQQIKATASQVVNDQRTKYYQQNRTLINQLADQFNQIEQSLQQLKVRQGRYDDLRRQVKTLRGKYTVNHQLLRPLSKKDQLMAQKIKIQLQNIKSQQPKLNQKLLAISNVKASRLQPKDYVIYGISLLLILIGLINNVLLVGVGLLLGISWFVYQHRTVTQKDKNIHHVQARIAQLNKNQRMLGQQVSKLQAKYHYPDDSLDKWSLIQNDLKRTRDLSVKLRKSQKDLQQMTKKFNNYFDRWSFMNRQLTLSSDYSNQLLQLKNYVNKMTQILKANQSAKVQMERTQKQLKKVKSSQQKVSDQLAAFYKKRNIRDADDFHAKQRQQVQLQQRQQTYRELAKQISSPERAKLQHYQSYDQLKGLTDKINQELNELKDRLQQTTSQLTTVQVKLQHLVNNGSYDELQQRAANARTEINQLVKQWLEESLASQWINTALNLATKDRVPKIERQAQDNFRTLTDGRYFSIVFNKSKIKVMRKDKQRFTLYELSKGTVQQLYLALIFAMAQVFGTDYPMPVMIDDGFTDFDVKRRQAAVNLLKSIGQQLQVIYCTSDENLADQSDTLNLNQF